MTDEDLAEACYLMTVGGMPTGVLCQYGDRKLPVSGYINIGGQLLDCPIPAYAATDIRLVAIAEAPIDSGVHR